MLPARVRSLRRAAGLAATLLSACALAGVVPAATAAPVGGGASLPADAGAVDPIVPEQPAAPVAEPVSTLSPAAALAPTIPPLQAVRRRADDPLVTDLAALNTPSVVVVAGGRVLVVRERGGRSELVDHTDPAAPRILLSGTRRFGVPHAGQDAAGRAVVVLSPCAGGTDVTLGGAAPRCPLRAVDVVTGASRPLPGTTGALAGDLDGAVTVFTRGAALDGARLYATTGRGGARPLRLPLTPGVAAKVRGTTRPLAGTLRLPAFDVRAGSVALVTEYRDGRGRATAALWLGSSAGAAWRRAAVVATAATGQGAPSVLGPQLRDGGVTAYVEGVVDRPSFVGRWSAAGALTAKLSVRRSIGRATILRGAALLGDRLVFVDWLPGVPCGSEGAPACGLRSVAPLSLP